MSAYLWPPLRAMGLSLHASGNLEEEFALTTQGSFPPALVNQFTNDMPQTIHDVRKVVLAKLKAESKLLSAPA